MRTISNAKGFLNIKWLIFLSFNQLLFCYFYFANRFHIDFMQSSYYSRWKKKTKFDAMKSVMPTPYLTDSMTKTYPHFATIWSLFTIHKIVNSIQFNFNSFIFTYWYTFWLMELSVFFFLYQKKKKRERNRRRDSSMGKCKILDVHFTSNIMRFRFIFHYSI